MYELSLDNPMSNTEQVSAHKGEIISLSNDIFGARIRIKEIHLHTRNQAEHLLTDGATGEFADVFDSLLEGVLGITDSKLELGSIRPNIPESASATEIFKTLRARVIDTKEKICDDELYSSIENILDDFLTYLNKSIYLSRNS